MDTILIIEDKESMLDMLKQTLEAEGYQVITARDGAEGIKKLADERIGLVLTDLKLPKKDGFEVLKAVKEDNPLLPGHRHDRIRHDRDRGQSRETGGL